MDLKLRDRIKIRQWIEAIPKGCWPAKSGTLYRDSAEANQRGKLDDETFGIWLEEIEARRERHTRSAVEEHDRFEGGAMVFQRSGVAMPKFVTRLKKPESVTLLVPDRSRRKPPKTAHQIRADRHYPLAQAKMGKCPADTWGWYSPAHQCAFSIVLLDIAQYGECTRPIKLIARSAGTSESSVQGMLRYASARRELNIERRICPETRRSISNRITTDCPKILAYQLKLNGSKFANPLENHLNLNSEGIEYESPLRGVKSYTHSSDEGPVEASTAALEVVHPEPDQESNSVETAVLEAPEPILEVIDSDPIAEFIVEPDPEPETDEEPLPPVEDLGTPTPFHYRPSWQPKMTMEEWAARHPKPPPQEVEHHVPIDDKLAAIEAWVREGAAGHMAPIQDKHAHRIERPDVHVALDDRWARMAADVASYAKQKDPEDSG